MTTRTVPIVWVYKHLQNRILKFDKTKGKYHDGGER
jgi:hypothetical protein